MLDTNLAGSRRVARRCLPLLEESADDPLSFVLITSVAARSASSAFTPAAYKVSKLTACRLVESVDADALVAAGEGVVAFALHSGAVLTPQTEGHIMEFWGKSECSSPFPFPFPFPFILYPFEFNLRPRVGFLIFMSVGVASLTVYAVLKDNIGLRGAFCVWSTTEKREWLSGRYVIRSGFNIDESTEFPYKYTAMDAT